MFGTVFDPIRFVPEKESFVWNVEARERAYAHNAKLAAKIDRENAKILETEIIPAIKARAYRPELETKFIKLATEVFMTNYADYYKEVC